MRLVRRGPVPVTGCPGCETAGEPITATRWLLQTWLWVPRRDVGDAALLLLVLDARQRWRIDRAAGGGRQPPPSTRRAGRGPTAPRLAASLAVGPLTTVVGGEGGGTVEDTLGKRVGLGRGRNGWLSADSGRRARLPRVDR